MLMIKTWDYEMSTYPGFWNWEWLFESGFVVETGKLG